MKIKRGQTAIVTGASTGLGVHIAETLASKGVHVALAARNKKNLQTVQAYLLENYDVNVMVIPTDISKPKDLEALVSLVIDEFKKIDILVNNAGVEKTLWFGEISREDISMAIDINLKGTMNLSHMVLPHMLKQNRGFIVNISSGTGYLPMAYNEVYATTKAGIIGFTKALRQSLQDRGCGVSATVVAPGFMDGSGMYENMKESFKVKAPRILGSNSMNALTKAFIKAIEKDKPDVIVSAGLPRLVVAMSILNQRSMEQVTKRFKVSRFFRSIAAGNANKERYKTVSSNVKNLVGLLWKRDRTRHQNDDLSPNAKALAEMLWKIDLGEERPSDHRSP